ncbi:MULTISPECIES: ATP-binding protein [unclassified Streptomyces]|uniref:ATP-binding protein n=1 Tax=unclassified Streptomyces TaxID=2593676 RepID=UPI001BE6D8B9|nr:MULTISPECIES: ATP-binding protein [unclassified Streptomyces]MBT2408444.1 ATP-binding protein [Streptomyces sp. ISL-21]MBT2611912.1 ATP-binding protein [Streptomyces sp. ISL-87]
MDRATASWRNTTHDWASAVDIDHLSSIRSDPAAFAPGGTGHLILEVVAYAADEAESTGGGRCTVTLHADGSVSVADDGRGTDTRFDDHGRPVKKPVMASKDLRFFDHPDAQLLPDGYPRRGMSVVAALSEWLVHTNRRAGGAWLQRLPAEPLLTAVGSTSHELARFVTPWPYLSVEVDDRRII